jgi:hypothetical protein
MAIYLVIRWEERDGREYGVARHFEDGFAAADYLNELRKTPNFGKFEYVAFDQWEKKGDGGQIWNRG